MSKVVPNEAGGKALADKLGELTTEPAELRQIASMLQAHADDLREDAKNLQTVADSARSEAAKFTTDGNPAPIYGDVLSSIDKVTGHYDKKILNKIAAQLEADAGA